MVERNPGTLPELTEDELKVLMSVMQPACHVVRVVNPTTFEARSLDQDQADFAKPYRCYSALCYGKRCQNCISMRAVETQQPVSKFEFVDGEAYFITAQPINYEGEPYSLELVQKVSADVGMQESLEGLQDQIQEDTDQEFLDPFTGAYARSYFDDGLRSVMGRKFALVKIENLSSVNREEGHDVGDVLVKRVAHELQKNTRLEDMLIRYEGDMFAIQFEDMDGKAFIELIEDISKALEALALEGRPQVRPMVRIAAVDEDNTYGELAQHALALLAEIAGTDERVVVRSADANREATGGVRFAAAGETLGRAGDDAGFESDELTGLLAASSIRAHIQRIVEQRHSREDGFCVLYLDVENFKQYNRTYGILGGDVLLKFIADSISEQFPHAVAARMSGDIFVAVTDESNVMERLETLRDLVSSYQKRIALELKVGVLELDEAVKSASFAIDLAKTACESVKGRYDLGVRFYDSDLDREISMNEYVVNNMERAIEQGHIKVFYQPIVRAMTGRVCDYEALCRWDDPEHGLLPPSSFIGALEKFRLINKIDTCMVRQVCQHQAGLLAAGEKVVPVSVNLSRLDFQLEDIFQTIEDIVAEAGIPRSLLNVEVTESWIDDDATYFSKQIDRFRAAGYEVWMDDFGSGYSSLNLLKDYRFDTLKIDMEFLAGFDENPRSREIIVTVVDMAKKLGIRTLVEGVETEQQYRFLQRIGCEMLQGYYFCKPLPYGAEGFGLIELEDASERAYFDELGSVNLLGASGAERAPDGDVTESELRSTPVALVEYREGSYSCLSVNEAYMQLLEAMGVKTLAELQETLAKGVCCTSPALMEQLDETRESGHETSRLHTIAGEQRQVHIRLIATSPDAFAFAVSPLPVG